MPEHCELSGLCWAEWYKKAKFYPDLCFEKTGKHIQLGNIEKEGSLYILASNFARAMLHWQPKSLSSEDCAQSMVPLAFWNDGDGS